MANATHTSVAGPDGALTHIRAFIAVTLTGWTLHRDLTSPPMGEDSAGGRELAMSKGNVLAGLRSTTTGTSSGNLFLFDGIPAWSASNLDEMPGNSGIRVTDAQYDDTNAAARYWNEVGGTWPNLWLFGSNSPNSYVHIVAEVSTGFYFHMWFGELNKIGTWTGGAYYGASFWDRGPTNIDGPDNTNHTLPFDAQTQATVARATTIYASTTSPTSSWISIGSTTDPTLNSVQRRAGEGSSRGNWGVDFWRPGTSDLSGLSLMTPIQGWHREITPNPDLLHPLGFVDDVRLINMDQLTPAQTITIGSDTWRVFPQSAKLGADGSPNSGVYGYAYRVF